MGPYRLEAVLGEGGMGRVYLGRTPAGSAVAVKVVHRAYAGDAAFRKRFEQEVATARRVQGLYTVPVVDADVEADEPWLAAAYVPGPSLQYAVIEGGPLTVEVTLVLIARVAEALQSIHAAGVIHRDLKPSNVILTAEGPKVIDFGIARAADLTSITGTGVQPGTPAYMAPEYILGQPLTPAADVFALGIVANFAATGELAFGGGSAPVVIHRILEQQPNLDGCPEPIHAIAAACLAKDPQQRPTPAEVIQQCHRAITAPPPSFLPATPTTATGTGPGPSADAPAPRPTVPLGQGTPSYAPTAPRPRHPRQRLLAAGIAGTALLGVVILVSAILTAAPSPPARRLPLAATLTDQTGVTSVAFSPDGHTLASTIEDSIKLWNVASRHEITTLGHAEVDGVVFSPDGKKMATSGYSGDPNTDVRPGADVTVTLWDVPGRKPSATAVAGNNTPVHSMVFSPNGHILATISPNGAKLWNVG